MPRPPKYAKSVDANQKEIVRLLNEIPGMKAVVIGDPVDVLVGYKAKNFLFEIKDGNKKDYEHRYTQKQREFLKTWPGQVRVAKSFEEVLNVLMDSYK
jgi:predicted outer membrane protein